MTASSSSVPSGGARASETEQPADARALTLLSLGAGVQSTALFILGCEGELVPKIDAAVFADTRWEPQHVMDHLDQVVRFGKEHGVPVHLASAGSLPLDVLNPHVFATLPAYTEAKPFEYVPIEYGPCLTCEREPLVFEDDEECVDCRNTRLVPTRFEKRQRKVTMGKVKRQCTPKYKVEPINRQVRLLLGADEWTAPCRYCQETGRRLAPWDPEAGVSECSVCRGTGRQRRVGSVPKGAHAEQWIGFSTDEFERVSDIGFPSYQTPRYPLLDLNWSRTDCENFLADRGWSAEKSACIGCPFHDDDVWIDMKHRDPVSFANAVAFDTTFRSAPGLDSERYLHESRKPLWAAVELAERRKIDNGEQLYLWGSAPRKKPRGCSPYGCRTTEYIEEQEETA